jgi:hypothetical protein
MLKQSTHTYFGHISMDEASGLRVIFYLIGRITSQIGAYVVTTMISQKRPDIMMDKFRERLS